MYTRTQILMGTYYVVEVATALVNEANKPPWCQRLL